MIVHDVKSIAFALGIAFAISFVAGLYPYYNPERAKPWAVATIVFGLLLAALALATGIGWVREG